MTSSERFDPSDVAWWERFLRNRSPRPKTVAAGRARRWHRGVLLSVPAVVVCFLALIIVVCQPPGHAQTSSGGAPYGGGGSDYGGGYGEGYGNEYSDMGYGSEMGPGMTGPGMMSGQAARQQLQVQVEPLLKRLRGAQSEDQKAAIKRELSGVLENHFSEDMQWRLKEIDSIQQRVQRLRDEIDRRKEAKDEILELQLKLLENEAAGLGFFGPRSNDAVPGGMGGMGMGMGGDPGLPGMMGGMEMEDYGSGGEGMDDYGMGGYEMGTGMYSTGPPPIPLAFQKRTKIDCVETPLGDAVDTLRDASQSNIYLDRQALGNAGVELETPINMIIGDVSVAMGLALIVDSVSGRLGVRFDDGVAVISRQRGPLMPENTRWESDGSKVSRQAAMSLAQAGDYEFSDVSLDEVLGYVQDVSGAPVFLHRRTLKDAGVSPQANVTISLKNVKHRTALRLILDSVDKSLYFAILDGVVIVAAAPPIEEEFYGGGMFEEQQLPEAQAEEPGTSAEDFMDAGQPGGLPLMDAEAGGISMGGAEEVDICELAFQSAEEKLKLVGTTYRSGETSALQFTEAQAERNIAERRLAQAKRRYAAQEQLLKLDLQQAESELEMAKTALDEATELNEQHAISRSEFREKEAAYRSAQLALARAETLLKVHRQPEPAEPTGGDAAAPSTEP